MKACFKAEGAIVPGAFVGLRFIQDGEMEERIILMAEMARFGFGVELR